MKEFLEVRDECNSELHRAALEICSAEYYSSILQRVKENIIVFVEYLKWGRTCPDFMTKELRKRIEKKEQDIKALVYEQRKYLQLVFDEIKKTRLLGSDFIECRRDKLRGFAKKNEKYKKKKDRLVYDYALLHLKLENTTVFIKTCIEPIVGFFENRIVKLEREIYGVSMRVYHLYKEYKKSYFVIKYVDFQKRLIELTRRIILACSILKEPTMEIHGENLEEGEGDGENNVNTIYNERFLIANGIVNDSGSNITNFKFKN